MKKTSLWSSAATALAMMILILDSKTALTGAAEGIRLCLWTVVPSLFPFLLLSNQLVGGLSGADTPILRPVRKAFGLPKGAEPILIPAFLGGYPIGAQCIGTQFAQGRLKKETAQRMLPYCSNIGPAFLFGMAGPLFPEKWMVWALWAVLTASAWMISGWFPCRQNSVSVNTAKTGGPVMATCIKAMGCICGWVLLFRVLIAFLDRWVLWLLPETAAVFLIGLLEISNGCSVLHGIDSVPLRFVLCSGMFAFGGICVWMQTSSVAAGLSLKEYLLGKALQAMLSMGLAVCIWKLPGAIPGILIANFLLSHRKIRNYSGNSLTSGV